MTRAHLEALHLEAAHLVRDGLCADHVDAKIAAIEAKLAENVPLHAVGDTHD